MWRAHVLALLRPRRDIARAGWAPPPEAIAVADHTWSFAAVAPHPRSVATLHFRALADARAVRRVAPSDVQMARTERYAGRRADLVLAYSRRVGRRLRHESRFVPIAYPIPREAVNPVEEPVAALLADWSWPPNGIALAWLLRAWPEVRDLVPGAKLLLGGRGLADSAVGTIPGVTVLGPVPTSADLLSQAAVVAFPCPSSSGPKVKVLEALAHGLPVVTTQAGAEGIMVADGEGVVVTDRQRFAATLAQLLRCPQRAAELGSAGRRAVAERHSPLAAAGARLAAFRDAFGPEGPG